MKHIDPSSFTGVSPKLKPESSSTTDFTMLDFVLDFFMKYLIRGIIPEKGKAQSENQSPRLNKKDIH